jgi:hypothetical protein
VESFNYVGNVIANNARFTRDIKSTTATAKAVINNKKSHFTSKVPEI